MRGCAIRMRVAYGRNRVAFFRLRFGSLATLRPPLFRVFRVDRSLVLEPGELFLPLRTDIETVLESEETCEHLLQRCLAFRWHQLRNAVACESHAGREILILEDHVDADVLRTEEARLDRELADVVGVVMHTSLRITHNRDHQTKSGRRDSLGTSPMLAFSIRYERAADAFR